jgi:hypothetical protein
MDFSSWSLGSSDAVSRRLVFDPCSCRRPVVGASGEGERGVVDRRIEREAVTEGELAGGVAEEDLKDLRLASGWRVGDVDDVGEAVVVEVGDDG